MLGAAWVEVKVLPVGGGCCGDWFVVRGTPVRLGVIDEDQWMYDNIMSEQVDMDDENEQECGVNEQYVDCSYACLLPEMMFCNGLDELLMKMDLWRSDTNAGIRGRTSFVLIGCERSGQCRSRKKDFVRKDTESRKRGCPFKLCGKPVVGRQGWMVKLMCGSHNHELVKSLVGHSYVGRLTKDEKTIIVDMPKSMVKPRNILLMLKEHNVNSCTTIKQIYNAISAYRSSIRGSDTEMQHLIKLKIEDVVCDIFWCHPDAVKLCNACNLVFLIDSTYKTNMYRLPLLDFVGVTPTGMAFSVGFAYLEGERVNNVIIPHKEKFVTAWTNKVMHLKNTTTNMYENYNSFSIRVDELMDFNYCICLLFFVYFKCKNNLGDLCSVWDAMNNMIMLQHTEIKASFETSTHMVGHVFKVTLYKRLLGMVSRYALNQIVVEYERVHYAGKNPSCCGCVIRTTHVFLVHEYVDALYFMQNSNSLVKRSASSSDQPIPRRTMPIFDQFHPFIHDFINNIVDVKADGNCGYHAIDALLELDKWSYDYIKLFGGTDKFEELKRSLLVDGLSMWMDIIEMGYVIASRYNVILVWLSLQQSMTFFPLRSQPPTDSSVHRIICIGDIYDNHFVQHCYGLGLVILRKSSDQLHILVECISTKT
ncbi:Protein FAR1-RELATED SEQUENCE 5 [Glycine soja]